MGVFSKNVTPLRVPHQILMLWYLLGIDLLRELALGFWIGSVVGIFKQTE